MSEFYRDLDAKEREFQRLRIMEKYVNWVRPTRPEDWPNDPSIYMCHCHACGKQFCGYKRRVTCRVCEERTQHQPLDPAIHQTLKEDSQ